MNLRENLGRFSPFESSEIGAEEPAASSGTALPMDEPDEAAVESDEAAIEPEPEEAAVESEPEPE